MGRRAHRELNVSADVVEKMTRRARPSVASLLRFDRPYLKKFSLVAGVDEAGRGPLAGPVVAAAVILPSGPPLHALHCVWII